MGNGDVKEKQKRKYGLSTLTQAIRNPLMLKRYEEWTS